MKNHCVIEFKDGSSIKLIPSKENEAAKIMKNGKPIKSEESLQHMDRLLFGSHNYFLVIDPSQPLDPAVDWEMASKELVQDQVKALTEEQEKMIQQKLKDMEAKFAEEKKKAVEEAKKVQEANNALIESKKAELGNWQCFLWSSTNFGFVDAEYEPKIKEATDKGETEKATKLKEELDAKKAEIGKLFLR